LGEFGVGKKGMPLGLPGWLGKVAGGSTELGG
jgi:hypothetical protein